MAKEMSTQQVLDILHNGNFEDLIGTIENEVIDFKGNLYQLNSTKEKLELAKDVSAFANANGGIILMGVGTSITQEHPRETIDKIRPFGRNMINTQQYEDIIADWIYPKPSCEVNWAPSSHEQNKGIAYISIPESTTHKKPFLVNKILDENDKVLGNIVGFFQRKGDKVDHMSAEELHHMLKDGLRFDEHLSHLSVAKPSEKVIPDENLSEKINTRINSAMQVVGLQDSTTYCLAVFPLQHIEIPSLFEKRDSDIVKLIENPPELRYAGFDLSTDSPSKIINGELRRVVIKPYKLLEVWQDGTIIFVADGDEGYLCWGDYSMKEFLRINTIALIESVYLFILFVKQIYEAANCSPQRIEVRLELQNIPSEKKYGLPKYMPGSIRWYANVDLVAATFGELVVNKELHWGKTSAEALAYQIVADFYAKFGMEHEFIPYTREESGAKVIDPEQIKAIR
jgi:hypothetical protein